MHLRNVPSWPSIDFDMANFLTRHSICPQCPNLYSQPHLSPLLHQIIFCFLNIFLASLPLLMPLSKTQFIVYKTFTHPSISRSNINSFMKPLPTHNREPHRSFPKLKFRITFQPHEVFSGSLL